MGNIYKAYKTYKTIYKTYKTNQKVSTPLSKIEDMRVKTEKLLITHGGSYPKINLQKFCNNKL